MMLVSLIVLLVHASVVFFTGTWKRWKEFYSTVLYVAIGDLTYNLLFSERLLWRYDALYDHRIAVIFYSFLVFPCAVMLYLEYFPKGFIKRSLYILAFTAVYSVFEYIALLKESFHHFGGWNIFWSAGLYIIAFILIRVHYRRPLIAWPISFLCAIATLFIFQQPFTFSNMP